MSYGSESRTYSSDGGSDIGNRRDNGFEVDSYIDPLLV